mmetsp:Transcript_29490/g.50931  ORF Transcript_29490/g.50931 Transcript_29490/m.50931 type:complete len:90 (+) Transcript_29490:216-485(+)
MISFVSVRTTRETLVVYCYLMKFQDGQQVTVQLSPGQHYNSQYVEITGEVNSDLTVRELKSCEYGDSFNMENYEGLVKLATGRFSSLFY